MAIRWISWAETYSCLNNDCASQSAAAGEAHSIVSIDQPPAWPASVGKNIAKLFVELCFGIEDAQLHFIQGMLSSYQGAALLQVQS